MAKNKVSEWSTTASNNTDIAGINIAEGCAPSGINNAIREVMAQIKDMQTGADSDGLVVGGAFTSSGGAVFSSGTTFSGAVVMSSTVTMSGTNNIGTTTSATILSGSVTHTSGSVLYLDAAATTASAPPLTWTGDTNTGIYRPAADTLALVTGGSDRIKIGSTGVVNIGGTVVLGTGDATTSVSGSILCAPSGSGTNIAGANFEINAGNGTGTGGSGNIILKTADVGSSGATANTLTQRLLVTPKGGLSFGATSTAYGTTGQVLKSNGDAPPSFGSAIISSTNKTASTTSVDFTDIPSWAKRVTVVLTGISLSGTSTIYLRLGSGSIASSGYLSTTVTFSTSGIASARNTAGFEVNNISSTAATTYSGSIVFVNQDSNIWVCNGQVNMPVGTYTHTLVSGYISLGGTLDRVSILSSNLTDTFDAGTINILYE
jgi:hypothetical protein